MESMQKIETFSIYSLSDPDSGTVRYIGFTVKPLEKRLERHVKVSMDLSNSRYVCTWIRTLLRNSKVPVINLVERVNSTNWQDREKYWIKHYKQQGCVLTNITDGGEGSLGLSPSQETRRKLSLANKGQKRNKDFCEKIRAMKMGNKVWLGKRHSKNTIIKMSASAMGHKRNIGRHHTELAKQRISEANLGRKHENRKPYSIEARISQMKAKIRDAKNKTSKYAGVYLDKRTGKWRASARINGKKKTIGSFSSETETARARDAAVFSFYGPGVFMNFPIVQ